MELTSFNGLKIPEIKFVRCSLREVDFTLSNLRGADFSSSDLTRSIFQQTNLQKANFLTAKNFLISPPDNAMQGAVFSRYALEGLLNAYGVWSCHKGVLALAIFCSNHL